MAERTGPFLIRAFVSGARHHPCVARTTLDGTARATTVRRVYPRRLNSRSTPGTLQLCALPNVSPATTLRSLVEQILRQSAPLRDGAARVSLQWVFPNDRGVMAAQSLGNFPADRSVPTDARTLKDVGFEAGDMLDIAWTPHAHSNVLD